MPDAGVDGGFRCGMECRGVRSEVVGGVECAGRADVAAAGLRHSRGPGDRFDGLQEREWVWGAVANEVVRMRYMRAPGAGGGGVEDAVHG